MRRPRKRHLRHRILRHGAQPEQPLVVLLTAGNQKDTHALAQLVCQRGGYERVEVAQAQPNRSALQEAVSSAASEGLAQVIVVPIHPIYRGSDGTDGGLSTLNQALDSLRVEFPNLEIVVTGPLLDLVGYADLIVHQVHQHDRRQRLDLALEITLASLPMGAIGRVRDLHGGQDLLARMAALGFTPGAEVTMVQNFGHGPVIVAIRGTRIALGRGEAGKVHIWRKA